jgi:hypothetical protein
VTVPPGRIFLPSPPIAKVRAIRFHARRFDIRSFVETGTYYGDTTAAVADAFDRCVTIELSPQLHARAAARFSSDVKIECYQGDSGSLLSGIIKSLSGPAIFWLDAHHSGGVTANAGYDPILSELSAIIDDRRGHVVLIDDARGHVIETINEIVAPNHILTVRNDIIRITPRPPGV